MDNSFHQRTWTAIILVAIIYLIVLVVPQMLLYGAGVADPLTFLICFALDALLWLLVVPGLLRLPEGDRSPAVFLRKIGLGPKAFGLPYWGWGLLGFGITFIGFLIPVTLTGNLDIQLDRILPPKSWMLLWGLKAGIFEEVAVRGVILVMLLKKHSPVRALVISSLLFGLGHAVTILLGNPVPDTIVQVLYATMGGLFFGYLFLITGSLLPGIVAHYLVDAFIGLLITPLFTEAVSFEVRSGALLSGWAIGCIVLFSMGILTSKRFLYTADIQPEL